tara:strand:- start:275 stop:610 length:336 start_codon:yes stop_codon:yes gene_type:complete
MTMDRIKMLASQLNGDFKPLYRYTVLTLGVISMYLNKYKKERIVELFSSYALWSDTIHGSRENHTYAIKRQAQCILELVDLGIPHFLEQWAIGVLAQSWYSKATYTAEKSA